MDGLWWTLLRVEPNGSQGFAGTILAALLVMLVLILLMKFTMSKPRNRRPKPPPQEQIKRPR